MAPAVALLPVSVGGWQLALLERFYLQLPPEQRAVIDKDAYIDASVAFSVLPSNAEHVAVNDEAAHELADEQPTEESWQTWDKPLPAGLEVRELRLTPKRIHEALDDDEPTYGYDFDGDTLRKSMPLTERVRVRRALDGKAGVRVPPRRGPRSRGAGRPRGVRAARRGGDSGDSDPDLADRPGPADDAGFRLNRIDRSRFLWRARHLRCRWNERREGLG